MGALLHTPGLPLRNSGLTYETNHAFRPDYHFAICTDSGQVGTVVDSSASSGRQVTHKGKEYDYVFDVDIKDGEPALKLPFNLDQNPYEVAQKFIADNELPISYLDQVANFILSNTQGATIGTTAQNTQAPGADPWGTENRYRPGEAGAPQPQGKYLPYAGLFARLSSMNDF